ncbi:MAG: dihydropteroate synthase [Bacteroidetes bacterium 4572_117]|nr:MAG: dihydropteroate synthase [Bacteroidetes bacterium 4572_117]
MIEKKTTINCRGKIIDFSKAVVMGILNITPDSFYDGNAYNNKEKVHKRIQQIVNEGALIVDIGAYSSRPGAAHISEYEELNRLSPALEVVAKFFPNLVVSVDTFRSGVARHVVNNYGVSIINDISAGGLDNKMFETVSKLNIPYIMMHMRGTPNNMQDFTSYNDLIPEIIDYFAEKIYRLKNIGQKDIIIDPGFGFSKKLDQNYELLKRLKEFNIFELPILAGISRKSMIYKRLNISPEEALNGTSVLNTIALLNGANILRVHDVKEAVQAVKLVETTFQ